MSPQHKEGLHGDNNTCSSQQQLGVVYYQTLNAVDIATIRKLHSIPFTISSPIGYFTLYLLFK